MQRGPQDREKAPQKASRWVLCPPQAFSFPERVEKASRGSGGTILDAADAGLRARFLDMRCGRVGSGYFLSNA